MTWRTAIAASAIAAILPANAAPPDRIIDRSGASVQRLELLHALREADYVLLGEVHDNAIHHRLQAELLDELASPSRALVMEQFDLGDQPSMDAAATLGYADGIGTAAGIYATRWNWAYYRPLVEIALDAGMPVVAANVSRADARKVAGAEGFAVLPRAASLKLDEAWNDQREAELAREIEAAHCGMLPPRVVPGMAKAQRARDAVMADRMLAYRKAVLIAGAGHARTDRGVPLYLRLRAPGAKVVSIGFAEEGGTSRDAFDYTWVTAAAERPDPCATFKPPA